MFMYIINILAGFAKLAFLIYKHFWKGGIQLNKDIVIALVAARAFLVGLRISTVILEGR